MKPFTVPTRETVSPANQAIFDTLTKKIRRVPNLYAAMAASDTALATYLALDESPTSLSPREREVVNLVVSQVNDCAYCLAAHTLIARHLGWTAEQVIEIRTGGASFDAKLDALAKLVRSQAEHRGHAWPETIDAFFAAGYTDAQLVDVAIAIGNRTITNTLHALTQVPVDFPAAPAIDA